MFFSCSRQQQQHHGQSTHSKAYGSKNASTNGPSTFISPTSSFTSSQQQEQPHQPSLAQEEGNGYTYDSSGGDAVIVTTFSGPKGEEVIGGSSVNALQTKPTQQHQRPATTSTRTRTSAAAATCSRTQQHLRPQPEMKLWWGSHNRAKASLVSKQLAVLEQCGVCAVGSTNRHSTDPVDDVSDVLVGKQKEGTAVEGGCGGGGDESIEKGNGGRLSPPSWTSLSTPAPVNTDRPHTASTYNNNNIGASTSSASPLSSFRLSTEHKRPVQSARSSKPCVGPLLLQLSDHRNSPSCSACVAGKDGTAAHASNSCSTSRGGGPVPTAPSSSSLHSAPFSSRRSGANFPRSAPISSYSKYKSLRNEIGESSPQPVAVSPFQSAPSRQNMEGSVQDQEQEEEKEVLQRRALYLATLSKNPVMPAITPGLSKRETKQDPEVGGKDKKCVLTARCAYFLPSPPKASITSTVPSRPDSTTRSGHSVQLQQQLGPTAIQTSTGQCDSDGLSPPPLLEEEPELQQQQQQRSSITAAPPDEKPIVPSEEKMCSSAVVTSAAVKTIAGLALSHPRSARSASARTGVRGHIKAQGMLLPGNRSAEGFIAEWEKSEMHRLGCVEAKPPLLSVGMVTTSSDPLGATTTTHDSTRQDGFSQSKKYPTMMRGNNSSQLLLNEITDSTAEEDQREEDRRSVADTLFASGYIPLKAHDRCVMEVLAEMTIQFQERLAALQQRFFKRLQLEKLRMEELLCSSGNEVSSGWALKGESSPRERRLKPHTSHTTRTNKMTTHKDDKETSVYSHPYTGELSSIPPGSVRDELFQLNVAPDSTSASVVSLTPYAGGRDTNTTSCTGIVSGLGVGASLVKGSAVTAGEATVRVASSIGTGSPSSCAGKGVGVVATEGGAQQPADTSSQRKRGGGTGTAQRTISDLSVGSVSTAASNAGPVPSSHQKSTLPSSRAMHGSDPHSVGDGGISAHQDVADNSAATHLGTTHHNDYNASGRQYQTMQQQQALPFSTTASRSESEVLFEKRSKFDHRIQILQSLVTLQRKYNKEQLEMRVAAEAGKASGRGAESAARRSSLRSEEFTAEDLQETDGGDGVSPIASRNAMQRRLSSGGGTGHPNPLDHCTKRLRKLILRVQPDTTFRKHHTDTFTRSMEKVLNRDTHTTKSTENEGTRTSDSNDKKGGKGAGDGGGDQASAPGISIESSPKKNEFGDSVPDSSPESPNTTAEKADTSSGSISFSHLAAVLPATNILPSTLKAEVYSCESALKNIEKTARELREVRNSLRVMSRAEPASIGEWRPSLEKLNVLVEHQMFEDLEDDEEANNNNSNNEDEMTGPRRTEQLVAVLLDRLTMQEMDATGGHRTGIGGMRSPQHRTRGLNKKQQKKIPVAARHVGVQCSIDEELHLYHYYRLAAFLQKEATIRKAVHTLQAAIANTNLFLDGLETDFSCPRCCDVLENPFIVAPCGLSCCKRCLLAFDEGNSTVHAVGSSLNPTDSNNPITASNTTCTTAEQDQPNSSFLVDLLQPVGGKRPLCDCPTHDGFSENTKIGELIHLWIDTMSGPSCELLYILSELNAHMIGCFENPRMPPLDVFDDDLKAARVRLSRSGMVFQARR